MAAYHDGLKKNQKELTTYHKVNRGNNFNTLTVNIRLRSVRTLLSSPALMSSSKDFQIHVLRAFSLQSMSQNFREKDLGRLQALPTINFIGASSKHFFSPFNSRMFPHLQQPAQTRLLFPCSRKPVQDRIFNTDVPLSLVFQCYGRQKKCSHSRGRHSFPSQSFTNPTILNIRSLKPYRYCS